jgi:hypothetical protein
MAKDRSERTLTVAVFAAALALGACSHRTPYLSETPTPAPSGTAVIQSRLILVGDAGEADAPVLADVAAWAGEHPEDTLVLFLGDNFYPEGMTPRRRDEADAKLRPQIDAATQSGARALFVPGNHDWDDGGAGGYDAILAQATYVNDRLPHPDGFLPTAGCPGPVANDFLPGFRIIAVDTQWWLHAHEKPVERCPASDPTRFAASFSDLIDTERTVVVAAHHPLFGFGRHAGFSEWREHLLPPVIGTVIALTRKFAPRSQDFGSEPYLAMTAMFRSAIPARPERDNLVIWAAGHEHSLQVLEGRAADYVLISGSGAKTTPVSNGTETIFAHSSPGFMVVDLTRSGELWLRVIEPAEAEVWTGPLTRRRGMR